MQTLDGLEVVVVEGVDGFGDGHHVVSADDGSAVSLWDLAAFRTAEGESQMAEVGEVEEESHGVLRTRAGPVVALGGYVLDAVELELNLVNPAQKSGRRRHMQEDSVLVYAISDVG